MLPIYFIFFKSILILDVTDASLESSEEDEIDDRDDDYDEDYDEDDDDDDDEAFDDEYFELPSIKEILKVDRLRNILLGNF